MEVIDMRLERVSDYKFKIFLSSDDLIERGLTEDMMLEDLPGVQIEFHEMMLEASDELDIDLSGILNVQIYMVHAQGMLIIVTKENFDDDDDFVEMQVTLSERKSLLYVFDEFEDIIQLAIATERLKIDQGAIYNYQGDYYLSLPDTLLEDHIEEDLIALFSEYGNSTVASPDQIYEYGKPIMEDNALLKTRNYFS